MWDSCFSNFAGRELGFSISKRDLFCLNDFSLTFLPNLGQAGGNLDLIFLSSSLVHLANSWVCEDTFGFDHFPVFAVLDISLHYTRSTSRRFKTKNLDWSLFRLRIDVLSAYRKENDPGLESITYHILIVFSSLA